MPFEKRLKSIGSIVAKNKIFLIILCIVSFLRLYRLPEFVMFLSDQGRDAIIVKRIVTGEHFPAIGAPTSIGQIFLGPFYYYIIAPFLFLFRLDPSGLAFAVAFYSIIGIIASYFILKKEMGRITALLFVLFVGFSSINIEISRFSWNPNLLPVFSFLTLYFLYKGIGQKKALYSLLFGLFFSFCFQLHYLSALLIIPSGIYIAFLIFRDKKKSVTIRQVIFSFFSFIVGMFPLILFDLRHDFLNSKSFLRLFSEKQMVESTSLLNKIIETNHVFLSTIFNVKMHPTISLGITIAVGIALLLIIKNNKQKKQNFLLLNAINFFSYILFFSFVSTPRHPHYYGQIQYSFFLLLALLFTYVVRKIRYGKIIIIIFLLIYIYLNSKQYYFFFNKPQYQIKHAQIVAEALAKKINNQPFNIATWPVSFSEDNYLYFLELKNMVPANREKKEITDQMFILCNEKPCLVLDSPSWNISIFGKAKIDTMDTVDGVNIYRLIHDK